MSVNASAFLDLSGGSSISTNTACLSGSCTSARGRAGDITINTGNLIISGSKIDAVTSSAGTGGNISVNASGNVLLLGIGSSPSVISTSTQSSGAAGEISVKARDKLVIDGLVSGISSVSGLRSTGSAGKITVGAGELSITNGGLIDTSTSGLGAGGDITVNLTGDLLINGNVAFNPNNFISARTGLFAQANGGFFFSGQRSGNAGHIVVAAKDITISNGGQISTSSNGSGDAGDISMTAAGDLVIAGLPASASILFFGPTGVLSNGAEDFPFAFSYQVGGAAGRITISASNLSMSSGGQISTTTAGSGGGGDTSVLVTNNVRLSGATTNAASGISASAQPGSHGPAGEVTLMAGGAIALSGGAIVTLETAGAGNGGTVQVTSQGPLSLSDPGSGIIASATPTASGNAGSVRVSAPQITIMAGGEIASTTAGTGAGGSSRCIDAGRTPSRRRRCRQYRDRRLCGRSAIRPRRLGHSQVRYPDGRGRSADSQHHSRPRQGGRYRRDGRKRCNAIGSGAEWCERDHRFGPTRDRAARRVKSR